MKIKMKNREIYSLALLIDEAAKEMPDLPVKIGFYIQKNLSTIYNCAQSIEDYKNTIFVKYGTKEEDGEIIIAPELRLKAQQELNELSNLEQEVEIDLIPLESFSNIKMNSKCLNAIMFMIQEEEELDKEE